MDLHNREIHLVTGGNGYIGIQVVATLLNKGFIVHTTVRNLNFQKTAALHALLEKHPAGQLKIFEADLLTSGSFAKAMKGCSVVHHIACPFVLPQKVKDGERQCIKPALEGTRNVLATVNETHSVRRVVLASSRKRPSIFDIWFLTFSFGVLLTFQMPVITSRRDLRGYERCYRLHGRHAH